MIKEISTCIRQGKYEKAISLINENSVNVNAPVPGASKYKDLLSLAFSNYFIFDKNPAVLNALIDKGADFYVSVNGNPLLFSMIKYNMHLVIEKVIQKGIDSRLFEEKLGSDLLKYAEGFVNKASYLIKEKFHDTTKKYVTMIDALRNKDIDYIVQNKTLILSNEKGPLAQNALYGFRKREISLNDTQRIFDVLWGSDFDVNYTYYKNSKNGDTYSNNIITSFYKNKFNTDPTNEDSLLAVYFLEKGLSPFLDDEHYALYHDVIKKDDKIVFKALLDKGLLSEKDNMKLNIAILNGNAELIELALFHKKSLEQNKEVTLNNQKVILQGCIERKKKKIIENYFNNDNLELNARLDIVKSYVDALYNEDISLLKKLHELFEIDINQSVEASKTKIKHVYHNALSPLFFSLVDMHKKDNEKNKKTFKKRKAMYDFLNKHTDIDWNKTDHNGQSFLFRLIESNSFDDFLYLKDKMDVNLKDLNGHNALDRVIIYESNVNILIESAGLLFETGIRPTIDLESFMSHKISSSRIAKNVEDLRVFFEGMVATIQKESLNLLLEQPNQPNILKKARL